MKELSIEDKAKRYEQAFLRAEKLKETCDSNAVVGWMEYIFPELKESEDERIRKTLIRFHKSTVDIDGIKGEEIIAWLENQGEQKTTIEMKTPEESLGIDSDTYNKIVDECIYGEQKSAEFDDTNAKQMFIKALERVEEQNNKGYKLTDCDKNSWWEDFKTYTSCIVEQEPAWSEEDEKYLKLAIDNFQTLGNSFLTAWLKSLKNRVLPQPKQEWSEEDEKILNTIIHNLRYPGVNYYKKPIEEQVKWLKSIRPLPKNQWSEEDEKMLNDILMCGEHHCYLDAGNIDWLKSIKDRVQPQKQWKPSVEQLEALAEALSLAKNCGEEYAFDLRTLLEQLEKLK